MPTFAGATCRGDGEICGRFSQVEFVLRLRCAMTRRSQTAHQLRLLGGELLIAENPLRVQLGELFYGGEHVCLAGDRLSADGLLLHRRRRRLWNPADRDNREAGDSNRAVLASKCKGGAAGLLL